MTEVKEGREETLSPYLDLVPKYFIQGSGKDKKINTVYQTNKEGYITIEKSLHGDGTRKIVSGDKVFILPGSQFIERDYREQLKKLGASRVTDIEKATLIISNGSILHRCTEPRMTCLAFTLVGSYRSGDIELIKRSYQFEIKGTARDYLLSQEGAKIARIDSSGRLWNHTRVGNYLSDTVWGVRPLGLKVLERVLIHKVPIVLDRAVMENNILSTVLDENSYESVRAMFKSKSEADHLVAKHILWQCDVRKSMYYIWKLSTEHGIPGIITYSVRDKIGKAFLRKVDIWQLSKLDEENFAEYLCDEKLLTTELFSKLSGEIIEEIKERSENKFYNVKLTINQKFAQYVKTE